MKQKNGIAIAKYSERDRQGARQNLEHTKNTPKLPKIAQQTTAIAN